MNIHELRHDPNGRYAVLDQDADGNIGGTFVTDLYDMLSAAHTYLEERGLAVKKPLSSRLVARTDEEEEHLLVYYGKRKLFVYRESDVYPMPEVPC